MSTTARPLCTRQSMSMTGPVRATHLACGRSDHVQPRERDLVPVGERPDKDLVGQQDRLAVGPPPVRHGGRCRESAQPIGDPWPGRRALAGGVVGEQEHLCGDADQVWLDTQEHDVADVHRVRQADEAHTVREFRGARDCCRGHNALLLACHGRQLRALDGQIGVGARAASMHAPVRSGTRATSLLRARAQGASSGRRWCRSCTGDCLASLSTSGRRADSRGTAGRPP